MSPNSQYTISMSNINYSIYGTFIAPIQNLLPRLPKILQAQFNQVMEDKVYGVPNAPKDSQLLKFALNDDKEQIITPLSIMIKCVSILYQAMYNLGPFASCTELGKQMRNSVNLFMANKEWDATHILNIKIEGPIDITHVVYQHQPYPTRGDIPTMVRDDSPVSSLNNPNCCLIGCEATPGPTPKLSTLTNHHLKVLLD